MEVLDYRSGDPVNGDHDRSVDVSADEAGIITVDNHFHGSHTKGKFTIQQICDQLGEARNARLYYDFCYKAGRDIPGFHAVLDAGGSPTDVVNLSVIERDIKSGVKSSLTVLRPLKLKM